MKEDGFVPQLEERLIRLLMDPATYPHHPAEVRFVQTHASLVFIAPPFVYKVKKPVNFGFLDFSTLEKRRHCCEQELILNRRLCSEGYLEIIPITNSDGQLALRGAGEIIEYALVMKQLSDDGFLEHRVESGTATTADLDRVVHVLTDFYKSQKSTAEIAAWGHPDHLRISTDESFSQTVKFIGSTITAMAHRTISAWTNRFLDREAALFEARVRDGWIRDCHGDLHLDHIHLTSDRVSIYDCIEFNERFRFIDVAADVAFLAMDLDYRGRHDLAAWFERRMSESLEDGAMPRLMDYYKSYRAFVRGKVESLHSVTPEAGPAERSESAERARKYFRLALRYVVAGSTPTLIAVMGRVACGKSTVAEKLAEELGWPCFSSDRIRKALAGLTEHTRTDGPSRAVLYSEEMTDKTYGKLLQNGAEAVSQSGGAVLDATFSKRSQRDALRAFASAKGMSCLFLCVEADDDLRCKRLAEREQSAHVISDARQEDQSALDARFEPPQSDELDVKTVTAHAAEAETTTLALEALALG